MSIDADDIASGDQQPITPEEWASIQPAASLVKIELEQLPGIMRVLAGEGVPVPCSRIADVFEDLAGRLQRCAEAARCVSVMREIAEEAP